MIEDAGDRISEQDRARLETMMQINEQYTQ
jgi:hypothetical protein